MTGFARREGGDGRVTWNWEVKSVNGRSLDVRCRVPPGSERLEAAAREVVPKFCSRGNLAIALTVRRAEAATSLRVNRELLENVIALAKDLEEQFGGATLAPARLDGLLAIRGIVEAIEDEEPDEEAARREAAMVKDLEAALEDLVAARQAEGVHLKAAVEGHLETIGRLTGDAGNSAAAQPEALRARLQGQVEELLQASPALPEERLAQEAALLVTRYDVREEIDRLQAHLEAARELLAGAGVVGRRLDFLCQEFNREANTLCSKASDVELTRIGLDLKTAVDQLREQVQNIE